MTKGEKTRQRIIESAASLFNRQGFNGVSITDIMRAVQLEKGGVYRHFNSKEELAVETFDYAFALLTSQIEERTKLENTAKGKLIAYMSQFQEFAISPPISGGCVVLNTAIEHDYSNNPILKQRAQKAIQKWHHSLCNILAQGIEDQEFHQSCNPKSIATMFIATLEGGMMMSLLYGEAHWMEQVIEQLKQFLNDSVFVT